MESCSPSFWGVVSALVGSLFFLMLSALLPLVAKVVFLVCHYHLVIEILHLVSCEVVWT